MTAAALLRDNPRATDEDIRRGLSGLKCRCGAHMSILRAVKRAQEKLRA
jgi:aerobic-type carbon monoxide dehydrogenase small subunit (CoxS/CutS family)